MSKSSKKERAVKRGEWLEENRISELQIRENSRVHCVDKNGYNTKEEAVSAARRYGLKYHVNYEIYRCADCTLYHLTKEREQ